MEDIFTKVYEKKKWGNNNNIEYAGSSGRGSSIEFNKDTYIPFLKQLINDKNIKDVTDLGCGDFRCGELIYGDLYVKYTGYDAYKKVVDYNSKLFDSKKYSFTHLDFSNNKEQIKNGDMCILKDVIQHWSIDDIYHFLDYLVEQKKFKYILICNCGYQTIDSTNITNGDFRQLSADFLPLKKYKPVKLFTYDTKEVSVIYV